MTISSKGRYALRTMLDLAVFNTGQPIRLRDVAKRQEISEKYLEQIVAMLNKAGLISSVRGSNGGYFLRKPPADYTVGEILRVTEGSLSPVECVDSNDCDRKDFCAVNIVWNRLNDAISEVVDNITLADLVAWNEEATIDYVI